MAVQTTERPSVGLGARVILTLAGAAGLIVGSLLDWVDGSKGTDAQYKVFWSTNAEGGVSFLESAGAITILIGLLAILGLAMRSGWLTRLAGALGVAAFVLFTITLYRVEEVDLSIGDIKIGMWLILAGGVLCLIAGFMPATKTVTTTEPAATAPPPPPA